MENTYQIKYPTNMYDVVKVKFEKELTKQEREQAVKIAEYWGDIHFVGTNFETPHVSDGNTLFIPLIFEKIGCCLI